jgi:DNA-binding LytR/AlgR family response regulator
MIIEDDLIIAENLKENFIEFGYSVTGVATNFSSACLLFEENKPDLIIADISLNGSEKDGIEIISYLCKLDSNIPVIYATSYHDQETVKRAKTTYPVSYLVKPYNNEQLEISLDIAINSFTQRRFLSLENKNSSSIDFIFVKATDNYKKVKFSEIRFLKADGSYCDLFLSDQKINISSSLNQTLDQIKFEHIIRCHRSYAVNINHIEALTDSSFFISSLSKRYEIPITQNRDKFEKLLPRFKTKK